MTCSGGAQVKAGISPTAQVLVDRSLWETVTGTPSSWFDWLLDIFVPQTIKATDLCALNLDDPPLPSAGDIAAALLRDPGSILGLYNFVRDKLRYVAFSNTCECVGSSICTTPWPSPTVLTDHGPGGSGFEKGVKFTPAAAAVLNGCWFWDMNFMPYGSTLAITLWGPGGTHLFGGTFTPSGGMPVHLPMAPIALTAGVQYTLSYCEPASFTNADSATAPPSAPGVVTWDGHTYAQPCGIFPTTASGGWAPLIPEVCISGATPPVAPVQPSQPADLQLPPAWSCSSIADICVRLQQVSEKLDWLIRGAPLVQSSSVAESTAHPGLTGTGSLTVSGIVGMRVDLTTIPAYIGGSAGTPTKRARVGRVDIRTAEGWTSRKYLTDTPLEWLGFDPTTTTVGYTLANGVVATITELRRGP